MQIAIVCLLDQRITRAFILELIAHGRDVSVLVQAVLEMGKSTGPFADKEMAPAQEIPNGPHFRRIIVCNRETVCAKQVSDAARVDGIGFMF